MGDPIFLSMFRTLHIISGVFWAGGILYVAIFVAPAVKALGAEGGKFMQQLTRTRNLPVVMFATATVNVVSGLYLFDYFSSHFSADFIGTAHGTVMSIGGLCALIAYFFGMSVNFPTTKKLAAMGQQIAQSGGAVTAEQSTQLAALRARLALATTIVASLLAITVICMSAMRYV